MVARKFWLHTFYIEIDVSEACLLVCLLCRLVKNVSLFHLVLYGIAERLLEEPRNCEYPQWI